MNHSSSFEIHTHEVGGNEMPSMVSLTFGSGNIKAAIATDIVSVGGTSANMDKGLLLMLSRRLRIFGPFEGILGLGLPKSILGKTSQHFTALTEQEEQKPMAVTRGFLQQAGTPRFSVCADPSSDGVLRLSQPAMPEPLGVVGRAHWSVELSGVSIGEASSPSHLCSRESMRPGQLTPCAAILDSGTTLIMAPKDHLVALFADLCKRWPRCIKKARKAYKVLARWRSGKTSAGGLPRKLQKVLRKALAKLKGRDAKSPTPTMLANVFQKVLLHCSDWVNASHGLDQELPPIHFTLAGADGKKRVLQLAGAGYVHETMKEDIHYVKKTLGGVFPIKVPVKSKTKKRYCTPAFGSMAYNTKENGPVWILGLPIFYKYQVGYELHTKPPAVSFSEEPCGSCSSEGQAQTENAVALLSARSTTVRRPQFVRGPHRLPSFDVNEPL
jgi:hypothetical protein